MGLISRNWRKISGVSTLMAHHAAMKMSQLSGRLSIGHKAALTAIVPAEKASDETSVLMMNNADTLRAVCDGVLPRIAPSSPSATGAGKGGDRAAAAARGRPLTTSGAIRDGTRSIDEWSWGGSC